MAASSDCRGNTKTVIKRFILLLLMAWTLPVQGADDAITFTAYAYPPKLVLEGGVPTGPHPAALAAIAKQAGLRLEWLITNLNEETRMLDQGRRAFCTTGRLYTPERARRWAFLPYRFDTISGDIVVTKPALAPKLRAEGSVDRLIADPAFTGAVIKGTLYGDKVDRVIATHPDWVLMTGLTDRQLMQMVLAGRAHYAIVIEDEWRTARREGAPTGALEGLEHFGTLPPGPVFLTCSRGTSTDILTRLGAAMAALGYAPADFAQ